MKTVEGIHQHAAEQDRSEGNALKRRKEATSEEFSEKGDTVCASI